jgi:L-lactate utilization protein LutC
VAELLRREHVSSVGLPVHADGFLTVQRIDQLEQHLIGEGVSVTHATDDQALFAVDAAITGVAAAIAETGTVVCESGPTVARGSSLIPPIHVAVVAAGQLLPDLYDYLEELSQRRDLPANVNVITGPSKTADIEGVLVTGVHGPGDLHLVLVAEE